MSRIEKRVTAAAFVLAVTVLENIEELVAGLDALHGPLGDKSALARDLLASLALLHGQYQKAPLAALRRAPDQEQAAAGDLLRRLARDAYLAYDGGAR